MSFIRGLRRWCGIEPIIFLYTYWYFLALLAVLQYVYQRISEDMGFPYLNMTETGEGCGGNISSGFPANSTLQELEIKVQTASSELYMYYLGVWALSITIVVPFTGSYTDRRGRKPGLIAPLVGAMLETIVMILVLHLELPVHVLIAGGMVNGLTGNEATLQMATMSYITDTVDETQRAFRIALLQAVFFMSATLSQLTSGLWIEYLGYKITAWFELSVLALPLVYAIFMVQESRPNKKEDKTPLVSLKSLKPVIEIFTKKREAGRKNHLLIISCFAVVFFCTVGTFSVFALFVMRTPLCWSPSLLGYFMAYKFSSFGIGAAIGIKLLKKCSITDVNLCRIGLFGQAATLLMIGFSDKTWMLFLAPAVGILGGILTPVIYDTLSGIVGPDEQGSLFASLTIIQTLTELTGTMLFNNLYPLSLRFGVPGFVFFLSTAIMFVPMVVFSCIHFPKGPKCVIDEKDVIKEKDGIQVEKDDLLTTPL